MELWTPLVLTLKNLMIRSWTYFIRVYRAIFSFVYIGPTIDVHGEALQLCFYSCISVFKGLAPTSSGCSMNSEMDIIFGARQARVACARWVWVTMG